MRFILSILMGLFLVAECYAITVYEKKSDTVLKITNTKDMVSIEETTVKDLKSKKAELIKRKTEFDADIDAQIVVINTKISEAVRLNIIELNENGNVVK